MLGTYRSTARPDCGAPRISTPSGGSKAAATSRARVAMSTAASEPTLYARPLSPRSRIVQSHTARSAA